MRRIEDIVAVSAFLISLCCDAGSFMDGDVVIILHCDGEPTGELPAWLE